MYVYDNDYEWDLLKNLANIEKHGIDFLEAIETFHDPNALVFIDERHSENELRYYLVGKSLSGKVLTTWFTYRKMNIRIIGCAEWRKFRRLYETTKVRTP